MVPIKTSHPPRQLISYNIKDQLKLMWGLFDTLLPGALLMDPRVASWVLAPGDKGKNLHAMVVEGLQEDFVNIMQG